MSEQVTPYAYDCIISEFSVDAICNFINQKNSFLKSRRTMGDRSYRLTIINNNNFLSQSHRSKH